MTIREKRSIFWSTIAVLFCVVVFSSLTFFLKTPAEAREPRAAVPPLLTLPMTPVPVFSATMTILPSQTHVTIQDTLVVTVAIHVSEGCSYPVLELSLEQTGSDGPIFDYVSPPTDTVGSGVSIPFTYTLRAVTPGAVVLDGRAYGERYCGDFWNWTYVLGESSIVQVDDWPHRAYLPQIVNN